ncbi:alanine racemase, partial [Rhizobium hidalgonense]
MVMMNNSVNSSLADLIRQPIIELSSTALTANLSAVRTLAPNSKVVSMVKADAYGHGIAFALAAL